MHPQKWNEGEEGPENHFPELENLEFCWNQCRRRRFQSARRPLRRHLILHKSIRNPKKMLLDPQW